MGLLTAEQTGHTETAVSSANTTAQDMLEEVREKESASSQHKYTKIFTAEDRAKVGKYATENCIATLQRQFRELNLSESTVCYIKNWYLNKLAQCVELLSGLA